MTAKRFFKIFSVTAVLLLVVTGIFIAVTSIYVLSPRKLTPMVKKQMDEMLICETNIGEIQSTFLSTFPRFGVKINDFLMLNPVQGAPSDTLINLEELTAVIDLAAFWKKNNLIVSKFILKKGQLNIFTDSLGNSNLQVLADTIASEETEKSKSGFGVVNLDNIELKEVDIRYHDHSMQLYSIIHGLDAKLSGVMANDSLQGNLLIDNSVVDLTYDNAKYLQKARISMDLPLQMQLSRQKLELNQGRLTLDDIELLLNGSIENDTLQQRIITNIEYALESWPVDKLIALASPFYHQPGLSASGYITSRGTISGEYSDKQMPLMDIELSLQQGGIVYPEVDLPLRNIFADFRIHSDFQDATSFVRIENFKAETDSSTFSFKGEVDRLFTDIRCQLQADANLQLAELSKLLPAEMKTRLSGKIQTSLTTDFTMAQLNRQQWNQMKLSGSANVSQLDVVYDTISLQAEATQLQVKIPNSKAPDKSRNFAFAKIITKKLSSEQMSGYVGYLQDASIDVEISDPGSNFDMPFTRILFKIDSLAAKTDSVQVAIAHPAGALIYRPAQKVGEKPSIKMDYQSNKLATIYGLHTLEVDNINLQAEIENDTVPEDIFQQWLVQGFLDLDHGAIAIANLSHPIDLPSITIQFDPQYLDIEESHVIIDESDFQLNGKLNNLLSYFRGDSILRGKFNFISDKTNISQLMKLTSGIGHEQDVNVEHKPARDLDDGEEGPYMVPKGVDFLLTTNIKEATYGIDTASNISGKLRINDGIMLLDEYTLATTAAKMQLSAMYKTPRKNHLYLGLDYHMLEVEIEQLLKTIPDIDSLMPMLRSFGGKGEFHLAVETYLDSMYNLKQSTLRGAASIKGQDLVLMDGETFGEIAKKLKFNKKTENRVDSLSAEFTIFRNEIDIYPFLLVMDKYKAVVAGRHNFDLSFDYHISVVDCPLPIKLGIDVRGTIDDLEYSLAKCRYKEFYRPSSRKVVENKQLELRQMIRESLLQDLILN